MEKREFLKTEEIKYWLTRQLTEDFGLCFLVEDSDNLRLNKARRILRFNPNLYERCSKHPLTAEARERYVNGGGYRGYLHNVVDVNETIKDLRASAFRFDSEAPLRIETGVLVVKFGLLLYRNSEKSPFEALSRLE